MNSHEPMKPPRMVLNWVAAKKGRYICMAENSNTEKTDDSTNEMPLETAGKENRLVGIRYENNVKEIIDDVALNVW